MENEFKRLNATRDRIQNDVRINWSDNEVRSAYWLTYADPDGWFENLIRSVYMERKLK